MALGVAVNGRPGYWPQLQAYRPRRAQLEERLIVELQAEQQLRSIRYGVGQGLPAPYGCLYDALLVGPLLDGVEEDVY